MSSRRVVITGIGTASPLGLGLSALWEGILEGKSGIGRISSFAPDSLPSQIAGEVRDIPVSDFIPRRYRKAVKVMAQDIRLAVAGAYLAVKDAGLATKCIVERGEADEVNLNPTRLGCNIGAGLICADLNEMAEALSTAVEDPSEWPREFSLLRWGKEGMENLTPLWLLKFLPNMLACHVTILHDAQGASNTITCAEASSHLAIGEAYRTIARGAADVCISGGAESKVHPMGVVRQSMLGRLTNSHNDSPEEGCRPFDRARDGTAASEGAGVLILEALDHARARDARIYGEIVGFGAANSAYRLDGADPDGRGVRLAVRKALADAKINPAEVDLIAPFGAGTVEHDLSESRGIRAVLGETGERAPVMAIKSSVGTNGSGSGAIDLAVAVKALYEGVVPHVKNCDEPDPECGLNIVRGEPLEHRANTLLTNGLALGGGQCAALAIRRFTNGDSS